MFPTVTGPHVVMIMVHCSFADYVAVFVRIGVTMMMIVVDNVGVVVAIDPSDAIFVVIMGARSRSRQNKRSDCQGTQGCLFHEGFGEARAQVIHHSVPNFLRPQERGGEDFRAGARDFQSDSTTIIAMAWCSVWLRVIQTAVTPRSSPNFLAPPSRTTNGSPLGLR